MILAGKARPIPLPSVRYMYIHIHYYSIPAVVLATYWDGCTSRVRVDLNRVCITCVEFCVCCYAAVSPLFDYLGVVTTVWVRLCSVV